MLMLIYINIQDMLLDLAEKDFFQWNEIVKNVIIFGVDMSSSLKIDNQGKDILILGKGPTQGLGKH